METTTSTGTPPAAPAAPVAAGVTTRTTTRPTTKATAATSNLSSVDSKKKFSKSLGSLLRYMEGMEIIVELKNGQRHRGILSAADEYMNLTLEDVQGNISMSLSSASAFHSTAKHDYSSTSSSYSATTRPPIQSSTTGISPEQQQQQQQQQQLLEDVDPIYSCRDIRGPTIRYIQFPDNADLTTIVKTGVDRERTAAKKYNRGKRKSMG